MHPRMLAIATGCSGGTCPAVYDDDPDLPPDELVIVGKPPETGLLHRLSNRIADDEQANSRQISQLHEQFLRLRRQIEFFGALRRVGLPAAASRTTPIELARLETALTALVASQFKRVSVHQILDH